MGQIEVFSPAKINLFLSVVGRMETGFHQLASLVAPLEFGDRLKIEAREASASSVELSCSDATLPTDERNLAYAAAVAFLARFDLSWKVRIDLEKRIPHGAGLGGGSSNASAVLEGLNALSGQRASKQELQELAARLGSDCPLFLARRPVIMRGRGELLSDLPEGPRQSLSGQRVVLFKPSFPIGTAWAYGSLAKRENGYDDPAWAESRLSAWREGELQLRELLHNSFAAVAYRKYLALPVLDKKLESAGIDMLMSGSGSCCFALVSKDKEESAIREIVTKTWGPRTFWGMSKLI
ncbi:4-(cytidine 5'-diphospho)-2-C-methyl-D-erythritol kinase [Pelagicoccus sp. SDUM812003]|uniref:4-(cytidine 5'-diphospho)-2-C-methyl-D-erythritol kinase n=1 Tax=Pelagicoccus sp. SDUM812003 TaxID=3041267 RepID=UPI00280FACFB|nr:4-(cytidine 5'-diphospho)-2-C-methyl-D-erythritol kinase [Pelagicoccus sp. SDUM812003]MDQ8203017.1 4-(cytidine 5'-diphospho)-2-C-methyl-D-erythritol kinase [Pelagicoccus sp. SDUM812003]